ncbi:transmembrane protein 272-like [Hyperolius riggenbachi]|uniref:transmembrane protein 272-like n=1 Tax=Hyperolius riggenbachi TaxID=752182 RepID=UPI0035A38951
MTVIGTLYIDKCPTEPRIPLYLLVAGAVYGFGLLLLPLRFLSVKLTFCLEMILCLFSFCWFTAGIMWVFSIYQKDPRDCDEIVYKFTFGILLFEYIFLAFIPAIVCLCSCCISFLSANLSCAEAKKAVNIPTCAKTAKTPRLFSPKSANKSAKCPNLPACAKAARAANLAAFEKLRQSAARRPTDTRAEKTRLLLEES